MIKTSFLVYAKLLNTLRMPDEIGLFPVRKMQQRLQEIVKYNWHTTDFQNCYKYGFIDPSLSYQTCTLDHMTFANRSWVRSVGYHILTDDEEIVFRNGEGEFKIIEFLTSLHYLIAVLQFETSSKNVVTLFGTAREPFDQESEEVFGGPDFKIYL
jgi:hypothetical protein